MTKANVATNDTSQECVDKTSEIVHEAQRTWVGLTEEEISELIRATHNTGSFVRAIEAKLKAKNT